MNRIARSSNKVGPDNINEVTLADLARDTAESVLRRARFPPGNAKDAQAGASGWTKISDYELSKLLCRAKTEAAAQQQK